MGKFLVVLVFAFAILFLVCSFIPSMSHIAFNLPIGTSKVGVPFSFLGLVGLTVGGFKLIGK